MNIYLIKFFIPYVLFVQNTFDLYKLVNTIIADSLKL